VEAYLPLCIESLIKQTYLSIEIILVDDGSTDNSALICDNYAKRDSRIIVFHKENGGLSDARNYGLEMAKGEYITFVDSDDFVNYNFIEVLYQQLCLYNAEVAFCDYVNVDENENEIKSSKITKSIRYSGKKFVEELYHPSQHGMEFIACGKLYKTELLIRNGISYPVGKIHEDMFTTYKVLYYANNVVFCNYIGYFYRQRNGSIMQSQFSLRNLDMVEAAESACVFFSERNEKELLKCATNSYIKTCFKIYLRLYEDSKYGPKHTETMRFKLYLKNNCGVHLKGTKLPILKNLVYKFLLRNPYINILKRIYR
jgi:glycosyltransferase involved in cell wall biosynthesis